VPCRLSVRPELGYPSSAQRRLTTSTVIIVVIGIWNSILLAGLGAVIHWRRRVLSWITQLDDERRGMHESVGNDGWKAFLAEHPELTDSGV
jgi:hypothetical protein